MCMNFILELMHYISNRGEETASKCAEGNLISILHHEEVEVKTISTRDRIYPVDQQIN